MSQPICAVTVPFPGVEQWLGHGADEGLWDLLVLKDGENRPPDGAEMLLLGAWHPAYAAVIDWAQAQGKRVAVAWSSSAGETDDAQVEVGYALEIARAARDGRISAVGCLHPDLVPHFPHGFYLPAPVHLPEAPPPGPRSGLAMYCPSTQKKNVLAQLMAAAAFQRSEPADGSRVLRTNVHGFDAAIRWLGLRAEWEPWMPRPDLLARLASSRVALCASRAESWCYGAVDAMSQGAYVVGSPAVRCVPGGWRVADPNSPREIARRIDDLWRRAESHPQAPRRWIESLAARQNEMAKAAVDRLLEL